MITKWSTRLQRTKSAKARCGGKSCHLKEMCQQLRIEQQTYIVTLMLFVCCMLSQLLTHSVSPYVK